MFASHRNTRNPAAGFSGGPVLPQGPMLELEFAELSDAGRVREHNEDYLGHAAPLTPEQAANQGWLFVLADGVGGQAQGEVASLLAVETSLTAFRRAAPGEAASAMLQRLVQQANIQVYEAGRSSSPKAAMATTIVACLLRHDRAIIAHVGDSRCYLIRGNQALLLTRDHTVAGEQVRMGLLSSQEAASAETRHVLSRCLGHNPSVSIDIAEHRLLAGDLLLLCCDGLYGSLTEPEIAALASSHQDLNAVARELVALANQKDGSDNISVQLIRIRNVERVGMYRGRPYRLR